MKSTFKNQKQQLHVGIIMDGNGRWAEARGLPRTAGHRAGADAVRRVVQAAAGAGVSDLTLYAFSSANWRRPEAEVSALMRLLQSYLLAETAECIRQGVRVRFIGRRDRLPPALRAGIAACEAVTAAGAALHLRIAVDYSARDSILRAAAKMTATGALPSQAEFARLLGETQHDSGPSPDVDLLIRTGGEQRLSDFLLWECAYAEIFFTSCQWPDFGAADLSAALDWYGERERRFGGLLPAIPSY